MYSLQLRTRSRYPHPAAARWLLAVVIVLQSWKDLDNEELSPIREREKREERASTQAHTTLLSVLGYVFVLLRKVYASHIKLAVQCPRIL